MDHKYEIKCLNFKTKVLFTSFKVEVVFKLLIQILFTPI